MSWYIYVCMYIPVRVYVYMYTLQFFGYQIKSKENNSVANGTHTYIHTHVQENNYVANYQQSIYVHL